MKVRFLLIENEFKEILQQKIKNFFCLMVIEKIAQGNYLMFLYITYTIKELVYILRK